MPGLPRSCEFEPRIQLLLGVDFQVSDPGTEHVIGTVCRVSPAVPPGLKPRDGFSLLAVVNAPGNAVTPRWAFARHMHKVIKVSFAVSFWSGLKFLPVHLLPRNSSLALLWQHISNTSWLLFIIMPSTQCSWILTEDLFWYKFFQNDSNYLIVSHTKKKNLAFLLYLNSAFVHGKKKNLQPWMFSYSVTRHFRSKTLKGSKKISKIKTPRSDKFFPRVVKTNLRRKQNTNQINQILSPLCFLAKDAESVSKK